MRRRFWHWLGSEGQTLTGCSTRSTRATARSRSCTPAPSAWPSRTVLPKKASRRPVGCAEAGPRSRSRSTSRGSRSCHHTRSACGTSSTAARRASLRLKSPQTRQRDAEVPKGAEMAREGQRGAGKVVA